MTTGELIRKCRKEAGLTQKELGERAGIAEPTIRKYESNRLNPKIETLKKIADALNVSVSDLSDNVQHTPILSTKELSALNLGQLRSLLDLYAEMCRRNPSRELQMQMDIIREFMRREQQRLHEKHKLEEQPKE
mgnify:CR=1 FL=1